MQSQEKIDIKNHINTNSKTNSYAQGQYKLTCPSCGSSRKKKRDTPYQ